jgi:hypothetical protein
MVTHPDPTPSNVASRQAEQARRAEAQKPIDAAAAKRDEHARHVEVQHNDEQARQVEAQRARAAEPTRADEMPQPIQVPPVHGPEQALAAMAGSPEQGDVITLSASQAAQIAVMHANLTGALKAAGLIAA